VLLLKPREAVGEAADTVGSEVAVVVRTQSARAAPWFGPGG
jgi:hypothetical protein